jgi:predicted nuclease of predicted toxin-antitoxin system
VKLLVDAQLPPRLAEWLRDQGHEAIHVSEIGLLSADDRTIWREARTRELVLLTKDRDFADWAIASSGPPQVVWLRLGNVGNTALIERLSPWLPEIEDALAAGARVVEAGRP